MDRRFLAVVLLGSLATAPASFAAANVLRSDGVQSVLNWQNKPGDKATLPPPPSGRSTVESGRIRDVDAVRDQLTLDIYGAKPMKILFDERTKVFRNGKRIPVSNLQPADHASIETVLDGTKIFALSVHTLAQAPQGEADGQVVNYDAGTGELTMTAALSQQPIRLRVPSGTPVVGVGQVKVSSPSAGLAELVTGTLVSVTFESGNHGRGIAKKIAILATPGSSFLFIGNVTFLDFSANRMVLFDPSNGKTYQISFDPNRFSMSRDIHVGSHVAVRTQFDGSHYVATAVRLG